MTFVINLPASPSVNEAATFVDASLTADTNPIQINGNGKTICAYGAIGSNIQINAPGGSVSLAWDEMNWVQIA